MILMHLSLRNHGLSLAVRPNRGCSSPGGWKSWAGVGKKILGVGLNFKNCICPAHPRLDVGLKKLRSLCEAYVKNIKRDHKKFDIWSKRSRLCICAALTEHEETSMNDESIDAENWMNEITNWLNDLKMKVAVRICCAYTKKKLSSLKILSTQISKTMRTVIF